MALQDSFDFPIAYDPVADQLVAGATFTVHATDDLAFATPLVVTDPVSGAAITPLVSSTIGVLPSFRVAGDPPQVILKSGTFVTLLTSKYGVLLDVVPDPTGLQEAADVVINLPTTVDGLMADVLGDSNSEFSAKSRATFVSFQNFDGSPVIGKHVIIKLTADGTGIEDIAVEVI